MHLATCLAGRPVEDDLGVVGVGDDGDVVVLVEGRDDCVARVLADVKLTPAVAHPVAVVGRHLSWRVHAVQGHTRGEARVSVLAAVGGESSNGGPRGQGGQARKRRVLAHLPEMSMTKQ